MSGAHVAVIGGGFSGTLQAIHLLDRGARVTLIERGDRLARGVAYSTQSPDHLLNVRASGMSAFPDRPDHFAAWLAREGEGDGDSFAQRRSYGRYVEGLLKDARTSAGDRFNTRTSEALDVVARDGGETVHLAEGERIDADAAVLALGNLPPGTPRLIDAAGLADGIYHADPWGADLADGLTPADTVLLIGTGLTAIDAALLLDSAGFQGSILALSRRGQLPRAHADGARPAADPGELPEPTCIDLLRLVRARAEEIGWRAAVDSLRPATQAIWKGAREAERARFLRHLRPWWDVHRHRIAPSIAGRVEAMVAERHLQIAAGRVSSVEPNGDTARLSWRARGEAAERTLIVRRIVNCTGPQSNIVRAGEPLLDALLAAGRIRPDRCRIGVDVDDRSRVRSADGSPADTLRAVGPITRGRFWEIVAVPDIRHQVRDVADALTC